MINNVDLLKKPNSDEIARFVEESSPLKSSGLSTLHDKYIVHKIAQIQPAGSIAVEVGTYLGALAALMAHANSNLTVHSYDLFDDVKYDPRHDQLVAGALGAHPSRPWAGKSRTLENVKEYLSRYSNIHLHKVNPLKQIVFDDKINLFIEDSSHRDPQLAESLNFWLPKVNVNGYVLLHDHRPWLPLDNWLRFVDVEKHVNILANNTSWNYLGNFDCFAIFQRVSD